MNKGLYNVLESLNNNYIEITKMSKEELEKNNIDNNCAAYLLGTIDTLEFAMQLVICEITHKNIKELEEIMNNKPEVFDQEEMLSVCEKLGIETTEGNVPLMNGKEITLENIFDKDNLEKGNNE